jgi:hypothetical protein
MNISVLSVRKPNKVNKQEIKSREVFSEVLKREERKLKKNEK